MSFGRGKLRSLGGLVMVFVGWRKLKHDFLRHGHIYAMLLLINLRGNARRERLRVYAGGPCWDKFIQLSSTFGATNNPVCSMIYEVIEDYHLSEVQLEQGKNLVV